jgi:hypothetical protein
VTKTGNGNSNIIRYRPGRRRGVVVIVAATEQKIVGLNLAGVYVRFLGLFAFQ